MTYPSHVQLSSSAIEADITGRFAFDDARLVEALKRCSSVTLEAARSYHRTGDLIHVPTIVTGIIERFVERDLRPRLADTAESLRLVEDLSIDSLTMMEIVLLSEEVLGITIDNEDLRPLRTLGDVQQFVDAKLRGIPTAAVATIPISQAGLRWPAVGSGVRASTATSPDDPLSA